MSYQIAPTYRGCQTVREYALTWKGIHVSSFDTKAQAVEYTKAHPAGPPATKALTYEDGKRVWR
jgi:hypothetical protein